MDVMAALGDALETGLPVSIAFLGVWMVFRTQDDFDLTVEGSFPLGAAIAGAMISRGANPWVAVGVAAVAGGCAACLTYGFMTALRLSLVLSSIVVGIGLFTVNLQVMGTPNVSLIGSDVALLGSSGLGGQGQTIALFAVVVAVVFGGMWWFLKTERGLAMRASGANPRMSRAQGVSTSMMLLLALVMGNALTSVAGALVAQQQGFADVNMGIGTILFGVTAILIGEAIVRQTGSPGRAVLAVLIGTIAYRFILALAFRAGVAPQYFRGLTALIVFSVIGISRLRSTLALRRARARTLPPDGPATASAAGMGGRA